MDILSENIPAAIAFIVLYAPAILWTWMLLCNLAASVDDG